MHRRQTFGAIARPILTIGPRRSFEALPWPPSHLGTLPEDSVPTGNSAGFTERKLDLTALQTNKLVQATLDARPRRTCLDSSLKVGDS